MAELHPGVFLLEAYDLIIDEPRAQRILDLAAFASVDDEGGVWRFYDDAAAVKAALRSLMHA